MSEFYSANEVIRISRRIPQFQLVKLSVSTGETLSFSRRNSRFQQGKPRIGFSGWRMED